MTPYEIATAAAKIVDANLGEEFRAALARDTSLMPADRLTIGQSHLAHEIARTIPTVLIPSPTERLKLGEQIVLERDIDSKHAIALELLQRFAAEVRA